MYRYYDALKKNHIFDDITISDMKDLSECFKPVFTHYNKGDYIFYQGEVFKYLGIVAEGLINIIKEDEQGSKVIIEQAEPGAALDESISVKKDFKVNVSAEASVSSEIIAIPFDKLIKVCKKNCPFHVKLLSNIVSLIASNHNSLTLKIDFLSKKGVRDKLVSFLSFQKEKHNSNEFEITFDRKELAEFLFVDRSALSRELGRMRSERKIEFHKNRFKIIKL